MRQETEGVTEALLESAKKEFLKYGFRDASLRRISANSGVSTNSIYTRFKDKAGLFSAVVKNAAEGLMEIYVNSTHTASECESVSSVNDEGTRGMEKVVKYVYENFDEFFLIFCRSQGTEYEEYFDRLAEIEEGFYKKFVKQYAQNNNVDDFFIHVYCRTGWQYLYELLSHGKSYEEAEKFMKNVNKAQIAGWNAVMYGK